MGTGENNGELLVNIKKKAEEKELAHFYVRSKSCICFTLIGIFEKVECVVAFQVQFKGK